MSSLVFASCISESVGALASVEVTCQHCHPHSQCSHRPTGSAPPAPWSHHFFKPEAYGGASRGGPPRLGTPRKSACPSHGPALSRRHRWETRALRHMRRRLPLLLPGLPRRRRREAVAGECADANLRSYANAWPVGRHWLLRTAQRRRAMHRWRDRSSRWRLPNQTVALSRSTKPGSLL